MNSLKLAVGVAVVLSVGFMLAFIQSGVNELNGF